MDKVEHFISFLESIEDVDPIIVNAVLESTYAIFEAKRKSKKKKSLQTVFKPYKHPFRWGGWFNGNYNGIAGVSDVGDMGMAGGYGDGGMAAGGGE